MGRFPSQQTSLWIKDDVEEVANEFHKLGYSLNRNMIPKFITCCKNFRFENSDYKGEGRTYSIALQAKKKGARKFELVDAKHPCWAAYYEPLEGVEIPQICYFPTFLFELPTQIYLERTSDETDVNAYYRQLLQDVFRQPK